jgi:methionyl-tRNA synthetase
MAAPFYITTPIYYVNARPTWAMPTPPLQRMWSTVSHHVQRPDLFSHRYGRTWRQNRPGSQEEGRTPREYVDRISGLFRKLWPELNISNDNFIRTTDPAHMAVVESILQRIYDAGDIYFSEYEGLYCFGCERFYTERELVDGRCPDHQTAHRKPSRNPTTFSK